MILLEILPLSKPVAISEMLILLALTAFIGCFIARWITNGRINDLKAAVAAREEELEDCHHKTKSRPFKSTAVSVSSKVRKADNLKVIEGIGPKIEQLLNENGILTFEQLANAGPETLKGILRSGGSRFFQIHDSTTWSEQSALARDGKWLELGKLQDKLDGGKVV